MFICMICVKMFGWAACFTGALGWIGSYSLLEPCRPASNSFTFMGFGWNDFYSLPLKFSILF